VTTAVIVEDDVLASMALAQLLEAEGFEVRCFERTDDAYASCIERLPDILITDWCVPGAISSETLVTELRKLDPSLRVICVSGYESRELQAMVESSIHVECVPKPIHFERFMSDIRGANVG
jgi:DNA-binding NtrC family response regulator